MIITGITPTRNSMNQLTQSNDQPNNQTINSCNSMINHLFNKSINCQCRRLIDLPDLKGAEIKNEIVSDAVRSRQEMLQGVFIRRIAITALATQRTHLILFIYMMCLGVRHSDSESRK